MPVIWNLSILYFISTNFLLVLISNFNYLQFTVLMSSLIAEAILLSWQVIISLIIIGIICSVQFYKYIDTDFIINHSTLQFKIIYSLLLFSTILIAFLKPKQEKQKRTEAKAGHLGKRLSFQEEEITKLQDMKNEFLRNLPHEVHTPVTGITSMV